MNKIFLGIEKGRKRVPSESVMTDVYRNRGLDDSEVSLEELEKAMSTIWKNLGPSVYSLLRQKWLFSPRRY